MTNIKRKTVLLFDTSALVYRSYHALPPLTTNKGEMVNAVYGVVSTILSVIKQFNPEYMIAAFDVKAPTFRHKAYAQYKATRKKTPDDLVAQLPHIRELMDAFGIPSLEQSGFEADDIIGSLCAQIVRDYDDVDIIIVTGDNDALQLVNDRVHVFALRRGINDTVIFDTKAVQEKYGLTPLQLVDFKGLAGDSSDNIPGVTGIGKITATKLLQKYDNLDGVFAHIDEISGAVRAKLVRDRAQAFLSRDLGTIKKNLAINYNLEDAKQNRHFDQARTFLEQMNFYSLLRRLPDAQQHSQEATKKQRGVADQKYATVAVVSIDDFMIQLSHAEIVACVPDVTHDNTLCGVAFSFKTGRAQYVPVNHDTLTQLKRFFAQNNNIVAFNAKEMWHILHQVGIDGVHTIHDVLLEVYVLHSGDKITFSQCVLASLGEEFDDQQQLSLVSDTQQSFHHVCQRADYIFKLHATYREEIAQISTSQIAPYALVDVLEKMELPLVPILFAMERWGVTCDQKVFAHVAQEIDHKIMILQDEIYHDVNKDAPYKFNINSTKQLREVLFDKLQLPTNTIKRTKTGYSTAASELEKLRNHHPIIVHIEEYRELFKLKTTYVDALPKLIQSDGRIHTTFNQAVTATGRLSSSHPNMQNIPAHGVYSTQLRSGFVAASGYTLISADYSQIDLRCVAHIANDKEMIAAFRTGQDIHTTTAMAINGVTQSKVTKRMRSAAKELNFGLIYGMGAFGFARSAGIDIKDAQKFIDAYFARFHGVEKYMHDIRQSAQQYGYVDTLFGRRRFVPEINSSNQQLASNGERMAINMPIQGTASDIMKLAMINVAQYLHEYGEDVARIILQVHDEIIIEVRADMAEEIAYRSRHIMEHVTDAYMEFRVPLVVDIATGVRWSEL